MAKKKEPPVRPEVTANLPAYPAIPSGAYDGTVGGLPATPNPLATAAEAVKGATAAIPDLKELSRRMNTFGWNQYAGRMPGYKDMAAQSSTNIEAALRGEVPEDVLYQLQQQAAERGVGAGVGGSPFSNAEYLKALGLTSLGQQRYGEEALSKGLARGQAVPLFDPSRFMVTPEQQQAAALQASTIAAAPTPGAAAAANMRNLQAGIAANRPTGGITYGGGTPGGGAYVPLGSQTPNMNISWPGTGFGGAGTRPDGNTPVDTYNPWSTDAAGNFTWTGGTPLAGNQDYYNSNFTDSSGVDLESLFYGE